MNNAASRKRSRSRDSLRSQPPRRERSRDTVSSRGSSTSVSTTKSIEMEKHYPFFEPWYQDKTSLDGPAFLSTCTSRDGSVVVYLYDRFKFVAQLGKGTFSKVALAIDTKERNIRSYDEATSRSVPEPVALKVFRGESTYDEAFADEVAILRILAQNAVVKSRDADQGKSPVVYEGSRFYLAPVEVISHPRHCALVFPVCGMTLLDLLEKRRTYFSKERRSQGGPVSCPHAHSGGLPLSLVRTIGYQLLSFCRYLKFVGVVHTDMKPENILVEHSAMTLHEGPRVGPLPITNSVKVIDFGSAEQCLAHKKSTRTIQTRHYRAPEVIFGSGWSFEADLWSVGLILVELYTGDCVFMTHNDEEHLAMMEKFIGPPASYDQIFGDGKLFPELVSASTGRLRWPTATTSSRSTSYLDAVRSMKRVLADESERDFYKLCKGLLEWKPSMRLTAKDALAHSFFAPI